MDWNKLQHTLFALDPSDPAEDLRKLKESADNAQESVVDASNFLQESVQVQEGTMPVEGDYSLRDFAALAGVTLTESQKTGSAGQAKGKDQMPKAEPGRTKHPLKDKLVGEDWQDGKDNYNKIALFKKMAGGDVKDTNTTTTSAKKSSNTVSSNAPRGTKQQLSAFLKKHSVALQQIAGDAKKTQRFETWLAKWNEGVEEGDGRKKGIHGKGHPMRKKQQAAIHAGEGVESIKEMLLRKLNAKK